MTSKHVKRCSTLLVIRDVQTKTIKKSTAYLQELLRLTISSDGEDAEKLELSYTSGRNAKWHFGKYLVVSYKVKHTSFYLPLVIYSGEIKTYIYTNTCTLFIIAPNWNNPNVHQLENAVAHLHIVTLFSN